MPIWEIPSSSFLHCLKILAPCSASKYHPWKKFVNKITLGQNIMRWNHVAFNSSNSFITVLISKTNLKTMDKKHWGMEVTMNKDSRTTLVTIFWLLTICISICYILYILLHLLYHSWTLFLLHPFSFWCMDQSKQKIEDACLYQTTTKWTHWSQDWPGWF